MRNGAHSRGTREIRNGEKFILSRQNRSRVMVSGAVGNPKSAAIAEISRLFTETAEWSGLDAG